MPALSQSAENQLLKLVRCYVTSSTGDDDDNQCLPVYDVISVEDAQPRDDGDVMMEGSNQQPNQGRWTVDDGQ